MEPKDPNELAEDEPQGPIQFEWASKEQQEAVEAAPGKPLLLMGGFNSGKTSAAILHMLALADAFPGYKVAVLRSTFKDLSQTTRPSFDSWIDKSRIQSSNANEVVLKNGSRFLFHHLDTPESATVLKGLEINAAMLDQAEQMQERTFTILLGRLGRWRMARVPSWVLASREGPWPWRDRSGRPIPPISIVLTANPAEDGDPELHWLWQRFHPDSKLWREVYAKRGYKQIVFDSRKNRFAGEQNIEILMEQDEDYVARFVRGEWVKPKGHLFRVSNDSIVESTPELLHRIKTTMALGRVLDHGDSAPTCCLWYAIDGEGSVYIWREYYQEGVTKDGKEFNVSDHRRAITVLSEGLKYKYNLADPSIFDKTRNISGYTRKQQRWSVFEEYTDRRTIQENTAIFWTPADNNEMLSRSRIKEHLKLDSRHMNPITKLRGAPRIYFLMKTKDGGCNPHGCEHVVSELRAASRMKVGENDGVPIYSEDRDKTIPDHAFDCLRYILNSRPMPQAPEPTPRVATMVSAPNGRVIMTVPPVDAGPPRRMERARGWKSRAGGY